MLFTFPVKNFNHNFYDNNSIFCLVFLFKVPYSLYNLKTGACFNLPQLVSRDLANVILSNQPRAVLLPLLKILNIVIETAVLRLAITFVGSVLDFVDRQLAKFCKQLI